MMAVLLETNPQPSAESCESYFTYSNRRSETDLVIYILGMMGYAKYTHSNTDLQRWTRRRKHRGILH